MSVLTHRDPQHMGLRYTPVGKSMLRSNAHVGQAEFLSALGLGSAAHGGESNQLAHCPPSVRVAIAMHYLWDHLIRSNWRSVQLLAFAYCHAAHHVNSAMTWINTNGVQRPASLSGPHRWAVARIQPHTHSATSVFANRLLRSMAVLFDNMPSRATDADQIKFDECRNGERSGTTSVIHTFDVDQDMHAGYWAKISEDRWNLSHGLRFKRVPHALTAQFFRTVQPLFQPYLEDAFDHLLNPEVLDLHVRIDRPRSTKVRKVVSVSLCYLMEELVEMLPYAVNHTVSTTYPRHWTVDVVKEFDRYAATREEFAIQVLARRSADLSSALSWHDAVAESAYLTPKVKPREQASIDGFKVAVPGLNRQRAYISISAPATV